MNFYDAFLQLLQSEGGFVDNPADSGGATMWGITEVVARVNGYRGNMRNLSKDFAAGIYFTRYWQPIRADELPESVRFDVFDGAVNSGVKQSSKWLQRAAGAVDDGVIGPKTIAAAEAEPNIHAKYNGHRLEFLTYRDNWSTFGRGWALRIARNLKEV